MSYSLLYTNYRTLVAWCDSFFERAASSQPLCCSSGCSSCCVLTTVSALEAAILYAHRGDAAVPLKKRHGLKKCWLLNEQGRCSAYAHRPLICRTHGLLLLDEQGVRLSCQKNDFLMKQIESDMSMALDTDRITENLMRLNLAFCVTAGNPHWAQRRFSIRAVQKGHLPKALRDAAQQMVNG